jgi:hypothetical protein
MLLSRDELPIDSIACEFALLGAGIYSELSGSVSGTNSCYRTEPAPFGSASFTQQ